MTRANRVWASRMAAMLAVPALVLAACGDDDEGGSGDGGGDSGFLTMATGSTGGTYFPLGGAIAQQWTDQIDGLRVSTQATGASVDNMQLLNAGEIDLAMAINGTAAAAVAGEGDFEGEEYDVTHLANIYHEVNQIVARADAGIETVEDLDGKRVAIGPPGSGTEVFARKLMELAGITVEEFQDTFGDAADRLRDGSIDASFAVLALPAGSLEEIATSTDLVLVSLEGDLLEQVLADDPTLTQVEAPAGTYANIDEPATLVSNWAGLYARSDLDEDTAYNLVKTLYESKDAIVEAHAVGAELDVRTAAEGRGEIPLHPGAERYYEEQGVPLE